MSIKERIVSIQRLELSSDIQPSAGCVRTLEMSGLSAILEDLGASTEDLKVEDRTIENGEKVIKTITWNQGRDQIYVGVRDGSMTFHGNSTNSEDMFFRKVQIGTESVEQVEEAFAEAFVRPFKNVVS